MKQLSPQTLQHLYQNNLIVIQSVAQKLDPLFACNMKCLMEKDYANEENFSAYQFVIVIKTDDLRNWKDLSFCASILNACKLDLNEVLVLNLSHFTLTQSELEKTMNTMFFIFNVSQEQFFISVPIQHYIEYKDKRQNVFLFSPSLQVLENAPMEKKQLWIVLKKILSLN